MSRKLVLLTALIIVLAGTFGLAFKVQRVEASGTIYIRADGSIDGPANITTVDLVTYYFTDNNYDEIVVERSDIVIDGNARTLQGLGFPSKGICLFGVSNVTVKHVNIQEFWIGIHLNSTSHVVLYGNNMENNDFAVWLDYSSNNTISGNIMKRNDNGIWLAHSPENIIYGNDITANTCLGVGFAHCPNNTVSANNIEGNKEGIYLDDSSDNVLAGNNITANSLLGIWHYGSLRNIISRNNIKSNYMGVSCWYSSNNTISGNNIIANSAYGIHLESAYDNELCHNNFIDNIQHVHILEFGYVNSWDNGLEGNYWSSYAGVDSDYDGIGDFPHILDSCNKDNYPLMGMFSSFNTSSGYHVNVISNSTIESFEYFEANSTIRMYVSYESPLEIITFGFCRVCIPYELMNVTNIQVIIDDGATTVLFPNYTQHDNNTHGWIYFAYEHSTHKIDIIPEFQSFLILPLFMIATLLAVIIYKRKHQPRNKKGEV
jgi:parallel beta-helix repeat protein